MLQMLYFKGESLTHWSPSKKGTTALVQSPCDMRNNSKENLNINPKDVAAHSRCSTTIYCMSEQMSHNSSLHMELSGRREYTCILSHL